MACRSRRFQAVAAVPSTRSVPLIEFHFKLLVPFLDVDGPMHPPPTPPRPPWCLPVHISIPALDSTMSWGSRISKCWFATRMTCHFCWPSVGIVLECSLLLCLDCVLAAQCNESRKYCDGVVFFK
eukprot:3355047-Amphidinium_carterae.1